MIKNPIYKIKGQTTIEALVLTPVLIFLTVAIFFCTYILVVRKWADYWVYRAALCQTQTPQKHICKKKLQQNMSYIISKNHYHVESLWITKKESHVSLVLGIASSHLQILPETQKASSNFFPHPGDLKLTTYQIRIESTIPIKKAVL